MSQAGDIEIYDPILNTWWPAMLVNQFDGEGTLRPKMVAEQLFASEAGSEINKQLLPDVQEDWSRGMGLDYDWAPGVYTRSPGYACPAGHPVEMTSPSPLSGYYTSMVVWGATNDLFVSQIGQAGVGNGMVHRSVGGTGALTTIMILGPNEYLWGLIVHENASGATPYVYAFSADGGMKNGRVHYWNGAVWTSTAAGAFGVNGRATAAKVVWTTAGVAATRVVTFSDERKISYTVPNADLMNPAHWVEGIRINGSRATRLRDMASSGTHIFISAEDGLFDLQEDGTAPNLLSYVEKMYEDGNGRAVIYHDGAIFYPLGTGLNRVIVEQNLLEQEAPGMCHPGWAVRSNNPVTGRPVAFCVDQGYLVSAFTNQINRTTYICWGKSRETLGIDSPNPMIWYGPEVVINSDVDVTVMATSGMIGTQRRLWLGCINQATQTARFFYVSLPLAGSPKQDIWAAGGHRYNRGLGDTGVIQPQASLYLLPNTMEDKASLKIIHEHAVGSYGLSIGPDGVNDGIGTKLVEYDRADPVLGSAVWPAGVDITTWPTQTIAAPVTTRGNEIERRIDFISPGGTSTPPKPAFLTSLRTTFWKIAPSFMVWPLTLQVGTGVIDRHLGAAANGQSVDPEYVLTRLGEIIKYGVTYMRDPLGRRKRVRLAQSLDAGHIYLDRSPGQAMEIRVEVIVLGDA